MTDKEIIKALECCSMFDSYEACKNCPNYECDTEKGCVAELCGNALNLINQQQAEIEKLKGNRHCSTCKYSDLRADQQPCIICAGHNKYEPSLKQNNIKTEAYKEFAELSKERLTGWETDPTDEEIEDILDDVLQELTERKEY